MNRRAFLGLVATPALADWPQFRGPGGQGLASLGGLPLLWSEDRNVRWKSALPGRGWSSPVVLDDVVWMTAAADSGRSLRALAVHAQQGSLLHDVEVLRLADTPGIHEKNTHASPTPLLEPDRVYVHFGAQGTAALDFSGAVLWRNQEHVYRHGHGTGGSPVLWEDLLIFTCDGTDRQFVAALDKRSGETVWTAERRNSRMAFSTPLVIPRRIEGEQQASGEGEQVVTTGGDMAVSYDPATGEELWRITYEGFSLVPRPVYAHGLVYLTSGFYGPTLFAVRPNGSGDVTRTHIAWSVNRGVPLTSSPVVVGDEIYMVSDNGVAACLDAKTGREWWRRRLGGAFSASPLAAGDRIYFTNEAGETTVIRAAKQYEELARNRVEGRTLASLAVDGDAILLRTDSHLYRIEE